MPPRRPKTATISRWTRWPREGWTMRWPLSKNRLRSIRLSPRHCMAWRGRYRTCSATTRPLRRQRIAELDADDVLAHTSLSVLYQKKGMIAEAEAEGAKARVLGWKQQLKKG